jgi:phage shock protein PspC (stress-responsive transcriptional regulator)
MTGDPTLTPAGGDPPPFAARYGLVRPLQGRYVAGVGAALGRATNTDPVLWRVVLAVLVCFGGVGALIYLLLWLVIPEEGDTGSPVEAMFGRGHSNTSPAVAVLLIVVAAVLLVFALTRPFDLVLLGAATILAAVVLLTRPPGPRAGAHPVPPVPGGSGPTPAPPGPDAPGPTPTPTGRPVAAAGPPGGVSGWVGEPGGQTWPAGTAGAPKELGSRSGGPGPPAPDAGPATAPGAATPGPPAPGPAAPVPAAPGAAVPGPPSPGTSGYRPPFAPHGPFAGPPPPPPPLPRIPRERSPLPMLVLSVALLVLGALGGLDLAGVLDVPAAGYLAAALAVVGAGLVTGAWVGRARPLIGLGVVLALGLPVAHAAGTWDRDQPVATNITWTPTSVADLDGRYQLTFGEGLLDLRQVDFAGQDVEISVEVTGGDIKVLVPPEVDVTANAAVFGGNATLFGQQAGGFVERTVTDPGGAGTGAGTLVINVRVMFGDIEVHR